MNVENIPNGQETITFEIEMLYTIMNRLCPEGQDVSIHFIDRDTHQSLSQEEDRYVRIVLWGPDSDDNRVIYDVMETPNIPCQKNEINELTDCLNAANNACLDLERQYEARLEQLTALDEGIRRGIDALPVESRWEFVQRFNPRLTIQDGLDLVKDPMNSVAIIR
jgi:hypothetical protein